MGIAAGAWAFGTLVVSLFIGGMVAARGGAIVERSTATTQGMLVWVLSILATTYLAAAGIGLGATALGRVTGGAAQLAGGSDLVADLNAGNVDRLLARLNDPQTASTIAAATGMSQPDVQRTLADASVRVQANRNDPTRAFSEARAALRPITDRLQQQAAQTAARAKPYAAVTGWATFVALVISLLAAILGGLAGRRRVEDAVAPYA
jgi:hypothetical protein